MQSARNTVILCAGIALTACMADSGGPAPELGKADYDALETTASCPTFTAMWQTNEAAFVTAIAPVTRVNFERRANGSLPTASLTVPGDEYLSCCGIRLDYFGDPGGRLIWTGNPESGFSLHAKCRGPDECFQPTGIRITFVGGTTAAGVTFPGSTNATVFDQQNTVISSMHGSSVNGSRFLGYQSDVLIDHAEFTHVFGGSLRNLIDRRCL